MARYHATKPTPTSGAVVTDTLEAVAREAMGSGNGTSGSES